MNMPVDETLQAQRKEERTGEPGKTAVSTTRFVQYKTSCVICRPKVIF
jgi:hypothetical protein